MEGKNPILIIYYSRSGHSEKIAKNLANRLNCDIVRVEEDIGRGGFMAYIRGMNEAYFGSDNSKHMKTKFDETKQYKSFVFVGPVYYYTICGPIKNACNEIVKQISATQHVFLAVSFAGKKNAGDDTAYAAFKGIFNNKASIHDTYLPCNESLYASGALEEKEDKFVEDILATLN
ncbi:Flavodoxin-like domain-containing protein [Entamoeba marina]